MNFIKCGFGCGHLIELREKGVSSAARQKESDVTRTVITQSV